jgi:WD40 repeat protein
MSDGRELGTFPGADCSFSPSGKLLATWAKRDTAVWDLATGRERFPAFSPSSPIAFSPDERRLLATRKDAIVVKETSTGNDLLELPGPTGRFAFSPDGSSIVAADFDRAKIWVADPAEAGPRPE